MTIFEIIPSDPKEALIFYREKLKEALKINQDLMKNGYEPAENITRSIFNYLANIRSLKKRIEN